MYTDVAPCLLQELLLQLVQEERERSQKAVQELIAEERLHLRVVIHCFLQHALHMFNVNCVLLISELTAQILEQLYSLCVDTFNALTLIFRWVAGRTSGL